MVENQYSLQKRTTVCETKLFSVFTDALVDVTGKLIAPEYLVVTPKNRSNKGVTGVAVVPFVDEKMGLVRVFRHAIGSSGWEVPRGFVDAGETAEVAALRELEEETGLSCDCKNLLKIGIIAPDPGILDARIQCFVARNCLCGDGRREVELGHCEFNFFPLCEIKVLIQRGDIQDAVSIALLMMFFSLK